MSAIHNPPASRTVLKTESVYLENDSAGEVSAIHNPPASRTVLKTESVYLENDSAGEVSAIHNPPASRTVLKTESAYLENDTQPSCLSYCPEDRVSLFRERYTTLLPYVKLDIIGTTYQH